MKKARLNTIWIITIIFPVLMAKNLLIFINTDSLSVYWLALPMIISIGILLKLKIMRWIMLFGIYLSFFYGLIGTETGLTTCFSQNLTVLFFTLLLHLILIYLLSHKSNCDFFGLERTVWIHETGVIATTAFWIIYEDMIYTIFLK